MSKFSAFKHLMYVQYLSALRSFASTFYSIVLPAFLFIIFGFVFGIDATYAAFFLPGMMGVMTSSDALFAVGPVIKIYHRLGVFREFKNYPVPSYWLFISFILSRLVVVALSTLILILLARYVFNFIPALKQLGAMILGVILLFTIYSFIALSLSFIIKREGADQSVISTYYFLGMFLSDAYFVLSARSPWLDAVGYIFPLKPVLILMRGDLSSVPIILTWLVVTGGISYWSIKRAKFARIMA